AQHLGRGIWLDNTVPANSPLCYSYVVKAQDQSQNKSGDWPMPQPADPAKDPSVCQRLRDTTPPPAAVITKLEASNSAVRVSWAAAPVQDIGAYYVYRSASVDGTYDFVGGLT